MSIEEFKSLALSFPGTVEGPHFDRTAFKVVKKRNFATLHEPGKTVNVRLTPEEQAVFCDFGKAVFPVPNKWGAQGWTTFELEGIPASLMQEALNAAYQDALKPKKKS